jgi:crotonobetainyl-CoA:carnitine CoA-transferase CaiB-like acyl-CoA transferase
VTGAGPLSGLLVADFSRVLAGPLAAMTLGDLGAEVIKVERPGVGDDTRAWGPPFAADGQATYYLSVNRNKRSLAVDLSTVEGQAAALELALEADILVENFPPGTMERFGLGYEQLNSSRLIYASVTGFGRESQLPGYDFLIQALGGLMSITGPADGEPTKVGVALLDVIAGLYAANGIQAALLGRERSGRGERVVVSLFETSLAALVNQGANYLLGGVVPRPMGNAHPNIVPYQLFHAADRPFILAAGNDRLFERAAAVSGIPAVARDERFATNAARVAHRSELIPILEERFATETADHWVEALTEAGVPCAPVRALDEVFAAPESRRVLQRVTEPRGELTLVADPIRVGGSLLGVRRPPPRLGEHTEEVVAELREAGALA